MGNLLQDLRFAIRTLVKKPGFALVAIMTLALGIGANTAIFSVVNSILLRPLAYKDPDRLVVINHNYQKINLKASVSAYGYTYYRDNLKSFESIAALTGNSFNLTEGGDPERLVGALVTANLFRTLGADVSRGRLFSADENQIGKEKVVLLSDALWQRRFGANPDILNRTITLNGESYTVVGIMPPDFQFGREIGPKVDLWAPIAFKPDQLTPDSLTFEFLFVVARLKDGVTIDQAQAEMDTIAANLRQQYFSGADSTVWGLSLQYFRELVVGEIKTALWILLGAVGLVLLIACANVANLLLARAADRRKEIAIRTALGAGRWRVVRQLLTESTVLSVAGGLLGLGIATWGVSALVKLNEDRIPRAYEIGIDWWVLGFTLLVSVLTGILFGLAPALQISKTDLHETLKEGGRTGVGVARGRMRSALVVIEMAVALVLLVGSGLLIRSFWRLQQINPGFVPQNTLSFSISLPDTKYSEPAQAVTFFQQALEKIRALPGVVSAGAVSILPMSGNNSSGSFRIEGRVVAPGQSLPHGDRWAATTDYFTTMKIKLVRGRFFDDRDTADSAGAAIIDETMARKYWPNEDPLGKRISYEGGQANPRWREIVGIVGHVKHRGLEGESRVQYYIPHPQRQSTNMNVVIRTQGEPTALTGSVRAAIRSIDRDLPLFRVRTMEELVTNSMAQRRFLLWLFVIFAGLALVLAAIGLYGVMSYSTMQRSHEIGIRMALGAQARDVLKMVLKQGMALALVGVAVGVAGAFALTRLMANLLYDVKATDPLTFLTIAVVLAAIALLACFVPARRATKVDPMVALRYE